MMTCSLGMGLKELSMVEYNKALGPYMKPLGNKGHEKIHKPNNMSYIGHHYPLSEIWEPLGCFVH
jgi:hypothetical protein